MKKLIYCLVMLIAHSKLSSQISELDNVQSNINNFVGWDANASNTIALNIAHKNNIAASDINFLTRNIQRMILDDNGRLGLGITAPTSLLHLGRTTTSLGSLFRTDGLTTEINQWSLFTGASLGAAAERFRLYADATATPWIGLRSASNGLRFETAGAFPHIERILLVQLAQQPT